VILGVSRAGKSTIATCQRQKCDCDDQEKFDCGEHARRFDLIRSPPPMTLLLAIFCASETSSAGANNCCCTTVAILGDAENMWAKQDRMNYR
jgi:hypothetical protein